MHARTPAPRGLAEINYCLMQILAQYSQRCDVTACEKHLFETSLCQKKRHMLTAQMKYLQLNDVSSCEQCCERYLPLPFCVLSYILFILYKAPMSDTNQTYRLQVSASPRHASLVAQLRQTKCRESHALFLNKIPK
jgi:hypothetical protein